MTKVFESSILQTPRLRLEPLTENHAAKMFDGLRDPAAYRHIPEDPPRSLEELAARYRMLANRRSPEGEEAWLNWALIDCNGEPHGYLQATVQLASKEAWIAYFVFASSQRRGYAGEALYALLPALREAYGIQRIHAEIDTRNVASIRLVESLGFEFVEHVRNADEFKGSTSDEFHYSLAGSPRCPPKCRSVDQ
ncbi:GNAT family N-acetyltransferase [Paraburkholderia ferrariae]|uniref:GNAT family N-acetyltransferase n=1 Tax=Paraburkholderia ferrariae TaxID=386056 RepID=UPI0005A93934|nr:GNAT family protein [Paraburkholderia ferrariae]